MLSPNFQSNWTLWNYCYLLFCLRLSVVQSSPSFQFHAYQSISFKNLLIQCHEICSLPHSVLKWIWIKILVLDQRQLVTTKKRYTAFLSSYICVPFYLHQSLWMQCNACKRGFVMSDMMQEIINLPVQRHLEAIKKRCKKL